MDLKVNMPKSQKSVPANTTNTPAQPDHDAAMIQGLAAMGKDSSLTMTINLHANWWGIIAMAAARKNIAIPEMIVEALEDWCENEQDNLNKTAAA